MFVLNITSNISDSIKSEWVEWHKAYFIEKMMETGLFLSFKFYELIEVEDYGCTYVTQFSFEEMEQYSLYMQTYQKSFSAVAFSKWGDQIISFRTLLRSVQ